MQENEKYILFGPFFSGLCNVIMSYEIALAISVITNRTLIIPPNAWCLFISEDQIDKSKWSDLSQVIDFDQMKKNFDVVTLSEVDEIKNIQSLIESERSYIGNIENSNLNFYKFDNPHSQLLDQHICFVNNVDYYKNDSDFIDFVSNRQIIDLNREEKYLVFDNCLFGHYWYMVYPGDAVERNILKEKINRSLSYKKEYSDLVENFVKPITGEYNAVHIRRNDFRYARADAIEIVNSEQKVLEALERLFPTNVPLYISTDEPNRDFFRLVSQKYKTYFFENFNFNRNFSVLESTIMEQVICSKANYFYGTYLSTYTKRINIMRGLENKQADDYMGINNIIPNHKESNILPWLSTDNKLWEWNQSSYWQWIKEYET